MCDKNLLQRLDFTNVFYIVSSITKINPQTKLIEIFFYKVTNRPFAAKKKDLRKISKKYILLIKGH